MRQFENPVLPGFYPDPSICRVGEDYYMVTSTFEYFPGVPIFHSKDLVNWRQIGHVLDRPSQLELDGVRPSGGIFAPTIRYNNGVFYLITTLVGMGNKNANFIVTTKDPAGDWSDPYWIEGARGIDPSLLFDDDGKVYYTGNSRPETGEPYFKYREIWLQELDIESMRLIGEKKIILSGGALKYAKNAEAPHLYKIDGMYYLIIGEGGTGHNHAVTVFRSTKVNGPYEFHHNNPILTHRHLGEKHPIVNIGHADLVETQNGEWWMVALGSRPYGGYFRNLGRETFMVPVIWEDGWPVVSPGNGKVEFSHERPNLPEHNWPISPSCDHFEGEVLADCWNFIRTPREPFWSLTERNDFLRLKLRPEKITDLVNPSFIGRRQQHINFSVQICMEFEPETDTDTAGLVLLQNNDYQYRYVVSKKNGQKILSLFKRDDGEEELIIEIPVDYKKLYMKVEAFGQNYSLSYATKYDNWEELVNNIDGRILSTDLAGGFVGAYIGMYASSNGLISENVADFAWFEYNQS